jgi:hypothetical protein
LAGASAFGSVLLHEHEISREFQYTVSHGPSTVTPRSASRSRYRLAGAS